MTISDLTKLFDIEYFDGPLLSLFAGTGGDFYLYKWYDVQPHSHQWLVFQIDYEVLAHYLNGVIPEYGLLNASATEHFPVVEFNEKGQPQVSDHLARAEALRQYAATKDAFFDYTLCPQWRAVQHFFRLKPMEARAYQD